MQGHRNDKIGLGQQIGTGTRHPGGKIGCTPDSVGMFKSQDETFAGPVITENRAGPPIAGRIEQTTATDRRTTGINVEGQATPQTDRRPQKSDGVPAARTQRPLRLRHTATGEASGRNQHIENKSDRSAEDRREDIP